MREFVIEANGLRFACLEAGQGPLLLLLHGFPDNAWTWEHQFGALAAAGYRVVAPFLRGYPPSEIPASGFYDGATLARDVRGLVEALSPGEPCVLVGQDWGAALSYGVLALYPDLVRRAVLMAFPHPAAMAASLADPAQIKRAFHWWYFQLPGLAEASVPANDFAFIDYLWADWSPGFDHRDHVAQVKQTLAVPGALAAAIGYYRAAFSPAFRDPALDELRATLGGKIAVPTLALCGADDIRAVPMAAQADQFTGDYEYREVPGCGHFLHRERPTLVNRLILDWLRNDAG
ncbi:MAG: alpha/beta hydrolase [Sphingomonas bacterium]|nr:alpha/beta hydrolase [Sphingomonas bacterium]